MLIVVDHKIPEKAKCRLSNYGEVLEIETKGITYEAISGHPDVFISLVNYEIIVAPNLPQKYKIALLNHGIKFSEGNYPVGARYPETAKYNVVTTRDYLIHNLKNTDPGILNSVKKLKHIHIEQAYTRCSLLALNDRFITSDRGIEKILQKNNVEIFYIEPKGIKLPGFENGFIGGCAGFYQNQLFLIGSLNHYKAGKALRQKLIEWSIQIVELYDGPLFDGGGILFLEKRQFLFS